LKPKSMTVRIRAETVELLRGLAVGMESWDGVIHRAALVLDETENERHAKATRRRRAARVRKSAGRGK
jgi:hypothetical protein